MYLRGGWLYTRGDKEVMGMDNVHELVARFEMGAEIARYVSPLLDNVE